ncbi:uncharacterized protein N0V89_003609 [Didymosphaeria variabile]|uniref:tRNA/rRNA methyltransferase SpoU type domain-containing protein n=1 Tax=Didymosphaeria variabile TaxID=1932322 RepID=A0A9W8XNQ1_9PLEO|nr:uncharacterized protein N0V89_003609 [Didymosphaeria variabile]KAJ4355589.1 hypothetical protein N0V89_003609 [Didymosphaeria variabile]
MRRRYDSKFGCLVFDKITNYIEVASQWNDISAARKEYHERQLTKEESTQELQACYKFLKCSYWLTADRYHYITPELVSLIVRSIGKDGVDDHVHDTLSSLLSLLAKSSVAVLKTERLSHTWAEPDWTPDKPILLSGVLSDFFFDRLRDLPLAYFSESASKAFRTWFQWISHVNANAMKTSAVYWSEYWSALRTGLLSGLADQRKYCLGILQQSLSLCQRSFEASGMAFSVDEKQATMEQYQKYCALFEIIVLDRYPNQVQACLPELTALLGSTSLISPEWTTALLAAALNSQIQEGVRKLIGNWYLNYATSQPESCTTHTSFLVKGFLPWVTQGSLFTTSFISTRTWTVCPHGEALAEAFAKLVIAANGTAPKSEAYSPYSHNRPVVSEKQAIIRGALQYVTDTEGRIFSPAVLYLLEGLLKGIGHGGILLDIAEINMIVSISRMPALPEIAADLCRTYCVELCGYRGPQILDAEFLPAQAFLDKALGNVQEWTGDEIDTPAEADINSERLPSLKAFLEELDRSQHKIIQNEKFVPGCAQITSLLENGTTRSFLPDEVFQILNAFWEEADRQDYCRPVAIRLAALFFHPTSVQNCLRQKENEPEAATSLTALLTRALTSLHRIAEGRTYLVSALATSLRRAMFLHPGILNVIPSEEFFVRFIENPPVPKKEFLFEVAAAQKLQEHLPRLNHGKPVPKRDYEAYYGQREWFGYAAVIDSLNRIPENQVDVAKQVMKRLLEPWRTQKAPIPIISKSKNVLQLQIMLLLTESCVSEEDADWYLDSFMHALVLEPWPRYRYLLDWIITRIYFRFPSKAGRILDDLANLDDNSPVHISSLMKLALLAAPFLDSDEFALRLMVQLIPFSASPKIQIRHEAHWSFPTLFDLAEERKWTSITGNPAFVALDRHVRSLDKFNAPPSTIRTLRLDAVNDFTLTNIFQGRYLRIETPDMEYVAHEDFVSLTDSDTSWTLQSCASPPRVPLGEPLPTTALTPVIPVWKKQTGRDPTLTPTTESTPTFHQTKSGFDIASLLPSAGPPSAQQTRPASVILIASLIDNPTNLGGLSRISESFGLEALYIDDLKKTAHKDFKATSVTSEKHFPIRELKIPSIPSFVTEKKREGYEVVGIEQTDRSGMLGEEGDGGKGLGTLPRKCVLVLGAERSGITAEVLAVVDRCVEIKTVGVTRSLNVQTAGGIAVYEWWREWGGKV